MWPAACELDSMDLEASSLTCLVSGLGWTKGWVQLVLSVGAYTHDLWTLPWLGLLSVRHLILRGSVPRSFWKENILRDPHLSFYDPVSQVTKHHFHQTLLVKVIISLRRFKRKAPRPPPLKGGMSRNLGSFFKIATGTLPFFSCLNMDLLAGAAAAVL